MESKIMEERAVIRKLNIGNAQYRKIIQTIRKRHEQDNWIVKRKTAGQSKRYLKLEAIDWIESVYFRDLAENYINAEIRFSIKHIRRLENELQYAKNIFPSQDMDIQTLSKFIKTSRTSLTQATKKLAHVHPEWYIKERKILIKEKGIEWLIINCYKKAYYKMLNEYKRDLQHRKRSESKHDIRKTY